MKIQCCILTIVIPHYKESVEFMSELLSGLDNQRLIDYSKVEILIVNDCGEPLKEEQFAKFKHIRPHLLSTKENAGVGVARQVGIDSAHGEYVMFIDADDCIYSPLSLFMIMSAIHAKPKTDLFHGQFIEEQIIDEQYGLNIHDKDITFCHGKVYRRAFLIEKNIRCHPTLRYNEDSFFNALVYAEAEKIEYIETPLIIWCSNPNSTVRAGGLYAYRELPCYIQSVSDLTEELVKRNKKANTTFLGALYYIYFQMQDEAWELKPVLKYKEAAMAAAAAFYKRHQKLYECGETERMNFYHDCRRQFNKPIIERQTIGEFIKELKNG